MSYDGYDETVRAAWLRSPFISLAIALIAIVVAVASFVRQQSAIDAANVARLHAQRVERELKFVHEDSNRLAGRVRSTERELRVGPIASRALKSVFTVSAGRHYGTAFVAWRGADGTYLITAAHVVDGHDGPVTLARKSGEWQGEIVRRDRMKDEGRLTLKAARTGRRRYGRSRCGRSRKRASSCCSSAAPTVSAEQSRPASSVA